MTDGPDRDKQAPRNDTLTSHILVSVVPAIRAMAEQARRPELGRQHVLEREGVALLVVLILSFVSDAKEACLQETGGSRALPVIALIMFITSWGLLLYWNQARHST